LIIKRQLAMNIAAKILISGLGIALAACGMSTESDVAKASHAANRELAKAQEQGDARVADAHAAASREINEAALKLSLKQARADYGEAIAKANGDLSIAVEKCAMQAGRARTACEIDARSMRDQSAEMAKVKLSLAD
jgi:hypothetical protein